MCHWFRLPQSFNTSRLWGSSWHSLQKYKDKDKYKYKEEKKRNTLRCDLGKIMKIRSIDFSGEWCYFQNQAFNMVLRNVKLILSHITSHFYRKCKNIWQRLSDRHNLFSFFSHEIGVKIGVKNTKLSPFPWGFPKKVIFKSAPKVVVINNYGRWNSY